MIKNNTSAEQDALLLFAVARKGGKVVAAGRGGVKKVRTDKPASYHVFFIGDPPGRRYHGQRIPEQAPVRRLR